MPPPYACMLSFSKLLSRNEPGDRQRWWFTARITGSSLTAAARRPCLSLWERCPVRTLGGEGLSVSQQPSQSASPPALPEGEPSGGCFSFVGAFWLGASVSEGFAVPHPTRLRRATFPPGEGFFVRPPPCIEPGGPQWRGSTTRVTGSH